MLAVAPRAQVQTLDDFEDPSPWTAVAADGVSVRLGADAGVAGRALRMDVDFHGNAGYGIARRDLRLRLPADYRLRLWLRAQAPGGGPAPVNDLELKLVGASGEDVWWHHRRRFAYPAAWTPLTTRARHVTFAWGPSGGGPPTDIAALEIAVTAQAGGAVTVWLDSLTLEPLDPAAPPTPPTATASANAAGTARAVDGDTATVWTAPPGAATFDLDLGAERALGGLTLVWGQPRAGEYSVQTAGDDGRFTTRFRVRGGVGASDAVPLPDTDARTVRLVLPSASQGAALAEVRVEPLAFASTPNAFFGHLAQAAPRGHFPRYLLGEAAYWTVVGADGDEAEALVGEDGTAEVGVGAFSVEPFLVRGGRLLSWADADSTAQLLAHGAAPVPTATRYHRTLSLATTAWVAGRDSSATLALRYRLTNAGRAPETVRLVLALRPFLVNPAYQFLSAPSGVSHLAALDLDATGATADGWRLVPDRPADAVGAASFAGGGVVAGLARGVLPSARTVRDSTGWAEGALAFDLVLPPGGARDVTLRTAMLPRPAPLRRDAPGVDPVGAPALTVESAEAVADAWAARLGPFALDGPPEVRALADAVRAQIGYVLVNRDGPAVQPGSRAYDRSWIRDGALTSAALLRVGLHDVARDFARWFAPFQYANGKVPCCVDTRGADPVPEHDSMGELVYLVAETYRHTGDRAFLREMWPHVDAAARFLDSLRATTRTPAYQTDSTRHLFGLLPPSISHEGYSDRPAYSYWDDLWALRGYRDAVFVAETLGETAAVRRLAASRDAFTADLAASVRAAVAHHGVAFVPGAADRGDFDATSTSIALDPVSADDVLPADALAATFERYGAFFEARASGAEPWTAYTPYEWRNVGALLRLGRADRAHALLAWLFAHRRPAGWQHWAEVVWADARAPRFIGDMPHTWVGSDMVRATLDLFAYTDGRPGAERLVVGAGVPARWAAAGVAVRGIEIGRERLAYRVRRDGRRVTVTFEALAPPPGGVVVHAPFDGPRPRRATADGRRVAVRDGAVHLASRVSRVVFYD